MLLFLLLYYYFYIVVIFHCAAAAAFIVVVLAKMQLFLAVGLVRLTQFICNCARHITRKEIAKEREEREREGGNGWQHVGVKRCSNICIFMRNEQGREGMEREERGGLETHIEHD